MAAPKYHLLSTFVLIIIGVIFYAPLALLAKNFIILAGVLFFGILIDIDHVDLLLIKDIIKNKRVLISKRYWLHNWWTLAILLFFSWLYKNPLPLIAYIIHILIDAGNITVLTNNRSGMLKFLYRFAPIKYSYKADLDK